MGGRGYGGGGSGRGYTYRYTVTAGMTCVKMGSDESHFNVSLIVRGQSHKTVSTNHNFWRERRAEAVSNRRPSAYQPTALPLGQTGSHCFLLFPFSLFSKITGADDAREVITFTNQICFRWGYIRLWNCMWHRHVMMWEEQDANQRRLLTVSVIK